MITRPEISVVVPAYQTKEYIRETLDSIYGQTYFLRHPFEVLVGVDKCQETYDELVRISYRYPNLRIIMMEENGGPFIIRNTLIALANADIISCFDSDDIMLPDLIERCMLKLSADECDAVQYRVLSFHDGKPLSTAKPSSWCNEGSMVLRKHCYEPTGGYKPWRCAADTEFRNRLMSCKRLTQLESPGYYYRRRGAALTSASETGFSSPIRKKYKEEILKGSKDPYVAPVTGKFFETRQTRTPYTLNMFTNCTGNADWMDVFNRTLASFRDTFGFADRVKVYMDRNPYTSIKNDCMNKLSSFHVLCTNSLLEGYKRSVLDCEHGAAVQLEHDWVFNKDAIQHSIADIIAFLRKSRFCHLRFNKRKNTQAGWDKEFSEGKGDFPHCISNQLSNNPHIIDIDDYKEQVLPMLKSGKGSKGIEEVISWKHIEGAIYGAYGCGAAILHIDGRAEAQTDIRRIEPDIKDLFSKSVLLNLDVDMAKYIESRSMLTELGVKAHRVPGNFKPDCPGLGCALTHKKAIELADISGWPYVLVMEDDIALINSISKTMRLLAVAYNYINNNVFDILYLGFTPDSDAVSVVKDVYKVEEGWGAYAYILPRRNFDSVIKLLPKEDATGLSSVRLADSVLAHNLNKKLFIPIFTVSPTYSNIKKAHRVSLPNQIKTKHEVYLRK